MSPALHRPHTSRPCSEIKLNIDPFKQVSCAWNKSTHMTLYNYANFDPHFALPLPAPRVLGVCTCCCRLRWHAITNTPTLSKQWWQQERRREARCVKATSCSNSQRPSGLDFQQQTHRTYQRCHSTTRGFCMFNEFFVWALCGRGVKHLTAAATICWYSHHTDQKRSTVATLVRRAVR